MQLQQYNKAVYYTKKSCVIFHQSKSSDVHGGWKIMSYSLFFIWWQTENSVSVVFFSSMVDGKYPHIYLLFHPLWTENNIDASVMHISNYQHYSERWRI